MFDSLFQLISPFGFAYLICATIAFLRSYQATAMVFALSYLFQTTAVINIGSIAFAPCVIGPFFLIIKGLRLKKNVTNDIKRIQLTSAVFFIFVIVQSIVAMIKFDGSVLVYAHGGMESAIAKGMIPYHFSIKQCIQWIYLFLNMGGLVSILTHNHYLNEKFSVNVIKYSIAIVIFLGLWKYIVDNVGGWFPYIFFFNNSSYELTNIWQSIGGKIRFSSLFFEASVCGLFLALFWWNIFCIKVRYKLFLQVITLLCLLLTVASTGFFCLFVGFVIYLIKKTNVKFILFFVFLGVIFYWIASYLNLFDIVYEMTINKSNSQSAEVRSEIMMSGLQILKDTYGWGIGLGASNGSGLALTLLGQTGVLGCLLFVIWLLSINRYLKNKNIKMQVCFWVVLLGMGMSIGYLSFPIFWLELIIICCMSANEIDEKRAI